MPPSKPPKRVLMVAYHFPPLQGSSGVQRTLRFVQHLPRFGWKPSVLTTQVAAYPKTSVDQLAEIPADTIVTRTHAFDASRHFSFGGRYPHWLALPDRWASWYPFGVMAGLMMVRRERPDLIWSTFPIATAHRIAGTLARLTRLPWIADFRDPMVQLDYPPDAVERRVLHRVEEMVRKRASHVVFTTPGAARQYAARYPELSPDRICVIENGYDEETFAKVEKALRSPDAVQSNSGKGGARFLLLHSGIVYPWERDPTALFKALAALLGKGILTPDNFLLRLRASGHAEWLRQLATEHGISDLVELPPPLPYREALCEMLTSDGLLVMQAGNCNEQIPAKFYEYLRSRKPILALTDISGDTAGAMRAAGLSSIVKLDDQNAIEAGLQAFLQRVQGGSEVLASDDVLTRGTRERRAAALAQLLDRAIGCGQGAASPIAAAAD